MSLLFNAVNAAFSRETVGHIAARLGEGKTGIGKALAAALPLVVGGLIRKAALGGGNTVLALGQSAQAAAPAGVHSVTGLLAILGTGATAGGALGRGEALLNRLFGSSCEELAGAIGTHAGIRPASARTLLHLAGAVLPALLAEHAAQHQLGAAGLAASLKGMKQAAQSQVPQELSTWAQALFAPSTSERRAAAPGVAELLRQSKLAVAGGGLSLLCLLGLKRDTLPAMNWDLDATPVLVLSSAATLGRWAEPWSLAR